MITFFGNDRSEKFYSKWLDEHKDYDFVLSCQTMKKLPVGAVNVHYGVLPFYRGMNPIYQQMMHGDYAGVTVHWIDDGWDTGDIIATQYFPHFGMTANEVYDKCEQLGLELLTRNLNKISNKIEGKPQDEKFAHYYGKDDVNWEREKKIDGIFIDPRTVKRIFAVHFEGKQYPIINISGRDFELRAK
jgi:methionyl-tRNA formyltransferase